MGMPAVRVQTLWLGITRIEAQEQIVKNSAADWPMMKDNEREKKHKELFSLAYPDSQSEKNFVSMEEAQRLLANG